MPQARRVTCEEELRHSQNALPLLHSRPPALLLSGLLPCSHILLPCFPAPVSCFHLFSSSLLHISCLFSCSLHSLALISYSLASISFPSFLSVLLLQFPLLFPPPYLLSVLLLPSPILLLPFPTALLPSPLLLSCLFSCSPASTSYSPSRFSALLLLKVLVSLPLLVALALSLLPSFLFWEKRKRGWL